MLMSMTLAPFASAMRAPSAIQRASQPASCTTCTSTPLPSARSRASPRPSTRAELAVISDTTSPAPSRAANRRYGASVTPDIGASTTGLGSLTLPIETGFGRKVASPKAGLRAQAHTAKAMVAFPILDTDMAGMVAAIVVAAGRGLRAGGGEPKQYRLVADEP